jgi:outer membrane immunogenic protein
MRCKSYWLATVSALAILGAANIAAPAIAADLPARMPVKAPVVAPAPFSWTGFYIGIHGGGAWLDHKQTMTTQLGVSICGAAPGLDCSIDKVGGAFGGLAGYNFQAGRVVYGIEADGTWLSLKDTKFFANPPFPILNSLTIHSKVDWLATVRGRLGITMSPTLLYVTGGAAFGGIKSGWFDGATPPAASLSVDKTKVGWVVGGGIEHAFASNWTARIEALYHDLGKVSAVPVTFIDTYSTTFRHRITTVRGAVALRW